MSLTDVRAMTIAEYSAFVEWMNEYIEAQNQHSTGDSSTPKKRVNPNPRKALGLPQE